jgi:hypothetical protein
MTLRAAHSLWLATALAAVPAVARAQGQGTDVAATALFDDGRKLMAQHNYAAACPKLAESQRLAPSGGTLINLADCYEHNGQTASAWVAWKDVAARANAAGKADAEKQALARASALEPSLAKLSITVDAASDVAGLEVKRDGVPVGHAEFATPIPVDPGPHTVEATAPGKQPFTASVDVAAKQASASLVVKLVDAPQAAPTPPAPAPQPSAAQPPATQPPAPAPQSAPESAPSSWTTQKTLAVVAGGVGVAGLAVGSVFGLIAKSKNDEALQPQNCRTSTLCNQNGLNLTSDAKSAANLSTISFIAGGVLLAGGVVLWVTAPSGAPATGLRITPAVAPTYGGLALDAAF